MRTKKWIVTALIVSLTVSTVSLARALKSGPTAKIEKGSTTRSYGTPKARVWVAEYMDFQCPTCKDAAPLMRRWLELYPGKIFYQVKYDPLVNTHVYALKSAIFAECANRQGKFWEYHDLLFERQIQWALSKEPPDGQFLLMADDIGLNRKALEVCVEDPAVKELVLGEREQAKSLGVKGTPTFFINGKMVVGIPAADQELLALFPDAPEKAKRR